MSEDPAFREKVLIGLARTETKIDLLTEHVSKINGSVRKLYEQDRELEAALHEHRINCTALDKIAEIDRKLSSGEFPGSRQVLVELKAAEEAEIVRNAQEKMTEKWQKTLLIPLIRWVIAGVVILFLLHANDMLHKFTGK